MTQNRFRSRRSRIGPKKERTGWQTISQVWTASRKYVFRTLIIATVLGGLYGGWIGVQQSPYFLVREVSIRSIPHLDDQGVLKRVGLDQKINIFTFDEGAAQVALLP